MAVNPHLVRKLSALLRGGGAGAVALILANLTCRFINVPLLLLKGTLAYTSVASKLFEPGAVFNL